MNDRDKQPNKPAGNFDANGKARDADDLQAVKNQSVVTPDDYPPGSNGKPETPANKAK